jgi:hypothetical protein
MLTNIEIIILSMQYSHGKIRKILCNVLPDGSNIAQVSQAHNIEISAITHWHGRASKDTDAYELKDEPGFVLARIVE